MKTPKTLTRWIFILPVLLICSCMEEVDLEQKRQKKIVVNCVLTTDSVQILSLSYSNPLNHFYYEEVENATATLFLDGREIGNFTKTAYGRWQIKHTPVSGGNYELKVEVPEMPLIEAGTTMPFPVWIERNQGNNEKRYFTQRFAASPYWIMILGQSKDTLMVIPEVLPGDQLLTSVGTNHPHKDGFNATDEMAIDNQGTTRENLAYIRINTPGVNAKEEIPFFLEAYLSKSLVVFRSASDEYDRYMKSSVQKMMVYHVFDDPTSWFDENEIYTNINNGLGIFAAFSDRIIQCHYDLDQIQSP